MEMLLRGETLKRWQAHKIAMELGAKNANEVRAQEDMNPRLDGRGDKYWEPQANYTTGATAQEPEPEPPEPPPEPAANARARTIVKKSVDSLVRKEIAAIERWGPRHAGKAGVWEGWLDDWYEKHQALLVDKLALTPEAAKAYCDTNKLEILTNGYAVAGDWLPQKKRQLIAAAIEEN